MLALLMSFLCMWQLNNYGKQNTSEASETPSTWHMQTPAFKIVEYDSNTIYEVAAFRAPTPDPGTKGYLKHLAFKMYSGR